MRGAGGIPHPLPDGVRCLICGAEPSGVHFGVFSCESCKLFFIRIRKSQCAPSLQCSKGGGCDINQSNRSKCRACRYARCVDTGMTNQICFQGRTARAKFDRFLRDGEIEEPKRSTMASRKRRQKEDDIQTQKSKAMLQSTGSTKIGPETSPDNLEELPPTSDQSEASTSLTETIDCFPIETVSSKIPKADDNEQRESSRLDGSRTTCMAAQLLNKDDESAECRCLPACAHDDPWLLAQFTFVAAAHNGVTMEHLLSVLPAHLAHRLHNMDTLYNTWFTQRYERTKDIMRNGDARTAISIAFKEYTDDFASNYFPNSLLLRPYREQHSVDLEQLIAPALSGYILVMGSITLPEFLRRKPVMDEFYLNMTKGFFCIHKELNRIQLSKPEVLITTAVFCFKTLRCFFRQLNSKEILEEESYLRELITITLKISKRTAILKNLNDAFETHISRGFSEFRNLLSSPIDMDMRTEK